MERAIPRLEKGSTGSKLIVDGAPFIALGGEVHNSSASNAAYMEKVWDSLLATNCNTAIVPVYWELLEPEEGQFDFALVDYLLAGARKRGLRLILLWFATWKNATSSYAPVWVKKDTSRFPRVQLIPGISSDTITPLCAEACAADSRAFAQLMRHLREVDSEDRTVIMMQVENESGLLGAPRDYSSLADKAYYAAVPQQLTDYLAENAAYISPEIASIWAKRNSEGDDWEAIFGSDAPEIFMAWHIARYIDAVTASGKAEYPLPMYANAWIVQQDGEMPGKYPSGGPVSKVHDIWRAAAPHIDALAPDIYLEDFATICADYARQGNPLIIPEATKDSAAWNVFPAVGNYNALCFAPFGIDSLADSAPLAASYALLRSMMPLITAQQGTGNMVGFAEAKEPVCNHALGNYLLQVTYHTELNATLNNKGRGLIIALDNDEFLVVAQGCSIKWFAHANDQSQVEFLTVDEGEFKDGQWQAGRRLNGDEAWGTTVRCIDLAQCKVVMHRFL